MAHGKRKQNATLLDELIDAPWLLIFMAGVVVFILLVWILPDLAPGNIILNSIFQGVASVAWVVFGVFFLFCAVFYLMSASSGSCLLYTSPSPRDRTRSRMPSSA